MAMRTSAASRAPRGTKTLVQAFFSAADSVPEAQRDAVVKAALATIRTDLQDQRLKAKAAKAKARAKGDSPVARRGRKPGPAKATLAPKPAPKAAPPKSTTRAALKAGAKPVTRRTRAAPTEEDADSELV